jgi:type I restriction enzyme S subunit
METTKDTKKRLPAGWRWVRLGEVCEIIAGQSPPGSTYRTSLEGLPFFQGKADFGLLNPVPRVWCVEPNKIALPGDILISVRAPVGPTNIADVKCCIGRGLAAIRCGGDADLEFILSALRHFESKLVGKGAGSTFEAISRDDLEQLSIPLPSLSEQRRIAGVLREQMAAIEKARAAAQARLEAVKTLPASLLRQVFPQPGQPLPDGWRWVKLGEVIEIVSGQVDPKESRYRNLPHVNGENIESGTGRLLAVRSAVEDRMTSGKYLFEAGVVLYSKLRPYLKKAAIADFRGLCSADMYPILPKPDELTLSFLLQIFLSEPFTTYAESESQRARMPKLNRDQLLAYSAPLPPLEDQRRIAGVLKEQMAAVEKARASAEAELNTINALPAALLRRAFNEEI